MVFYIHKRWLWLHTQSFCPPKSPPSLLSVWQFQQQPQNTHCGGVSYSSSPSLCLCCTCTAATCTFESVHTHNVHLCIFIHTPAVALNPAFGSHIRSRLPACCVTEQKLNPASGDWAGDSHTNTHMYSPHTHSNASLLCSSTEWQVFIRLTDTAVYDQDFMSESVERWRKTPKIEFQMFVFPSTSTQYVHCYLLLTLILLSYCSHMSLFASSLLYPVAFSIQRIWSLN